MSTAQTAEGGIRRALLNALPARDEGFLIASAVAERAGLAAEPTVIVELDALVGDGLADRWHGTYRLSQAGLVAVQTPGICWLSARV
jgi:hypothetical protein